MSALTDLYIKKDTLKTLLDVLEKKGENGISLAISISDQTNDYGQNVSAFVNQTKEDREAEKKKFYIGNGKVFWTDGKIVKAEKKESNQSSQNSEQVDDLPF